MSMKSAADDREAPLVAGSPPGDNDDVIEEEYVPCIIQYITLISRIWGIILLTALWSFCVLTLNDLSKYNHYAPWYLLVITVLTTFLELIWLINKCVRCRVGYKTTKDSDSASLTYEEIDLSRKQGCCCSCWRLLVWLDNWRKALIYFAFGIPMFIRELVTVYTAIAGCLLIIAAAFYFLKSFKESKCVARRSRKHANIQTVGSNSPAPPPPYGYKSSYPQKHHPQGYQTMEPPNYTPVNGNITPVPQQSYTPTPDAEPPTRLQESPSKPPAPKSSIPQTEKKIPEKVQIKQTPEKRKSNEAESKSDHKDTPNPAPSKDSEVKEKKNSSGEFKLFGLLKSEEKRKEPVIAMVSSQRSEEEDLETYPEDKNPFDDDDHKSEFEWDPDNRG